MKQCTVKNRIAFALRARNFFQSEKKNSLEVLESAEHLEDVIIEVERHCNCDRLFFRYDPEHCEFHRIFAKQEDLDLWRKDVSYATAHPICARRMCYNKTIKVHDFERLLQVAFEAVAVHLSADIIS